MPYSVPEPDIKPRGGKGGTDDEAPMWLTLVMIAAAALLVAAAVTGILALLGRAP